MSDIIYKLPDNVANQIAAGEVVQRPASVVKEMLENAIDAGATKVKVVIRDAGKTLIYIEDNGKGMSHHDALMCFERHATSKLKTADDLFHIATKGFRGEALASIAAIAHVELKTQMDSAESGTRVTVSGGRVELHETCATAVGTQFSVKNLFYNVPARRYFLKSDSVEWKHVLEEFTRVALVHPEVEMMLEHNGVVELHLLQQNFRQRVVKMMGNKFQEALVPIEEETNWLKITGFLSKPEVAKKVRGDQYFFVNNRFIKHPYLHHAIQAVYSGIIAEGNFPAYFIQMEIDPELIDVNIHPTKTEIKFQDERSIYAILHASARRALGMHNVVPSLDFNQEGNVTTPINSSTEIKMPTITLTGDYNPFQPAAPKRDVVQEWLRMQGDIHQSVREMPREQQGVLDEDWGVETEIKPQQFFKKWIVFEYKGEMWLVDQGKAHRQIQFEKWMRQGYLPVPQTQLTPLELSLNEKEKSMINVSADTLYALGYRWEIKEGQVFLTALPQEDWDHQDFWEQILGEWENGFERMLNPTQIWAWTKARKEAIRSGQMLTLPEMKDLMRELLDLENPFFTPRHEKIIFKMNADQLQQLFQS
jgi:DNA mismatch repair protein MutL